LPCTAKKSRNNLQQSRICLVFHNPTTTKIKIIIMKKLLLLSLLSLTASLAYAGSGCGGCKGDKDKSFTADRAALV